MCNSLNYTIDDKKKDLSKKSSIYTKSGIVLGTGNTELGRTLSLPLRTSEIAKKDIKILTVIQCNQIVM